MRPAAAAIKLDEIRQPALGQIVPLTRDVIEAGSALHCRHEWSVASAGIVKRPIRGRIDDDRQLHNDADAQLWITLAV